MKSVITPSPALRLCPICNEPLSSATMGVNSHLRKHVRRGELPAEREQEMRMTILHRTFKNGGGELMDDMKRLATALTDIHNHNNSLVDGPIPCGCPDCQVARRYLT